MAQLGATLQDSRLYASGVGSDVARSPRFQTMARITRKQADAQAVTLNGILGLPADTYTLQSDGTYLAQIGCIHICSQNGTNNIYQMANKSGGCRALAVGLTIGEVSLWLTAAIGGAQLAQGGLNTH